MLLETELVDSRKDTDPPLKTFHLKKEVDLRFLHFQLLEFWGKKGGGLQYFFVEPGKRFLRFNLLIKVQVLESLRSISWIRTVQIWALTEATLRLAKSCAIKRLAALPSTGGTDQSHPHPHQVSWLLL